MPRGNLPPDDSPPTLPLIQTPNSGGNFLVTVKDIRFVQNYYWKYHSNGTDVIIMSSLSFFDMILLCTSALLMFIPHTK